MYHVISRFVGGEWFMQEAERMQYLRLLGLALAASDWRCFAYALMSSHVHLAMIAGRDPLCDWVRAVHGPFGEMINKKHGRIGAVFVRGPSQYIVRDQFVPKLVAYIHNNPVRAGVVARAEHSGWTSHRAYVGLEPQPSWLDVDDGLTRAGLDSPADVAALVGGRACSTDRLGVMRLAGRIQGPVDTDLAPLVTAAARVVGIPERWLLSSLRTPEVVHARAVAIVCAAQLGVSASRAAHALRISEAAASSLRARASHEPLFADLVTRALGHL